MTTPALRASHPHTCEIHNKQFTRFSNGKEYSYGCPVCVRIIRDQVRALRASFVAFTLHRVVNDTALERRK